MAEPEFVFEDFLRHYGVRGMRWGQRGKASNYDNQQVKRDIQVYGKRGSKRINKALHDGDRISVARGNEKARRDRVLGKNKYVRQGGKIGGAVAGVVLSQVGITAAAKAASSQVGSAAISRILGPAAASGIRSATTLLSAPAVRVAVAAGAAKIGEMMAGDIAVSANMRISGYDPNKR